MPPIGLASRWLRPLAQLGGGLAAGTYGATTAEPDESPALRGLGYGLLGGVITPSAFRAAARPGTTRGAAKSARQQRVDDPAGRFMGYKLPDLQDASIPERISNFTYFSMLSSPDTILRGSFGAIGGAMNAALERGIEGAISAHTPEGRAMMKGAARGMKTLFSGGTTADPKGWRTYWQALRADSKEFNNLYRRIIEADPQDFSPHHTGGRGVGRFFGAPDLAAIQAMKEMGFTAAEAARYTLAGRPQTRTAREILGAQQNLREAGGVGEFVGVQSAPFARVGLLGMEKGLQRIPVIGFIADALARRRRAFDLRAAQAGIEGFDASLPYGKGQLTRRDELVDEILKGGDWDVDVGPDSPGMGEIYEGVHQLFKVEGRNKTLEAFRMDFQKTLHAEGFSKSQKWWDRYWTDLELSLIHI